MKLWLISQDINNNYDTFSAAIVAAETADRAKRMDPFDGKEYPGNPDDCFEWGDSSWVTNPDDVQVKFIGEAVDGQPAGVVLSSFRAG